MSSTKKFFFWLLMLSPVVLTCLIAIVFITALIVTNNLDQGKRPENSWAKLISKNIVAPSYNESRNQNQQQGDCIRLDDKLIYAPYDTSCQFLNREFDTTLTYKNGIRQEQSTEPVKNPYFSILVLGDSHAMGWGVNGDETFSAVIESSFPGIEVHNTGMSSYGLPRELMVLNDQIQAHDYDLIILQYCSNDIGESKEYIDKGFLALDYTIPVQSGYNLEDLEYRYTIRLAVNSVKRTLLGIPWAAFRKVNTFFTAYDEGRYTARALDKLYDPINSPPMVIFPVNGYANSTNREYKYLISAIDQLDEAYKKKITLLDPLGKITKSERQKLFYNFDSHMVADGHRFIGSELSKVIGDILNARKHDQRLQ